MAPTITEEQKKLLQNTKFVDGTNAWEYVLSCKEADQPWVVAGILSCMKKGYRLHEGQINWEARDLRYGKGDDGNI